MADGTVRLGATAAPGMAGFVALPAPVVNGVYTGGDTRNGLDRAPYSTMYPVLHNTGAWLYAEFAATPRLTVFLDASYRYRVVGTTYEPSTISLVGETGFGDLPGGRLVFPAANPYNPFGVDIIDMSFYLPEMGARDNRMTVTVPRIVTGLRGRLDHAWEWESAVTYTRNTVSSVWTKFLSDQALQDGLAGRLGGWLNPFGPSDPGVVDKMRTDLHDLQYAQFAMGDAQARGPLFAGWGGPVQAALGAEWREDRFEHDPDLLRSNGGLVSLAMRPHRDLRKTTTAVYAELSLPLSARAEVTAAVRWEHYRDFGDPVKPKFGARWQILPDLALRATYSEAFRTPELLQAYTDVQETFIQTRDPRRPDLGIYTMRVRNGGNPGLKPETTAVTYAGFIFEPSWLKGFELVADFWEYRQTNLIGTLGADTILANEATVAAGRIVRGPAPGPGIAGEVIAINDTFGNFNRYSTSGVDLELRYHATVGANRFTVGTTAVRLYSAQRQNIGFNATESVSTLTFANWRLNTDLAWHRGACDTTLFINWIGEQRGGAPAVGLPGGQSALAVTNLTFGFPGPGGTEWRLGANNLFNVDPPRNYSSRTGYLNGYYDAQGRTWLVSVQRRF
ncbi:MAG: TonB-dependent receptor [Lacunisphaera sp.]